MGDSRNNEGGKVINPLRRNLGDYVVQRGARYFSSITMVTAKVSIEMKPTCFSLIISHQVTGMDNKDPYTHLFISYELIGTMGFEEKDLELVCLRLFPSH